MSEELFKPDKPEPRRKAPPAPAAPAAYVVMELQDKCVPHGASTVWFRRDQVLRTKHLIELAKAHGINIKPYDPDNSYR